MKVSPNVFMTGIIIGVVLGLIAMMVIGIFRITS